MKQILANRKITAWLILLTFLFTCVVPTGTALAALNDYTSGTTLYYQAEKQIPNDGWGGTEKAEGRYDIEVSKTIAPTGIENYFDITLQTTTHRHHVDMSTDVVIVLDISNTMNSDSEGNEGVADVKKKITQAKTATNAFIKRFSTDKNLDEDRKIAVVTFNRDATVVVPLQEANDATDYDKIAPKVSGITAPTGKNIKWTNIQGGLKLAENILKDSTATHKYIILLTDGFPTTYLITPTDNNKEELSGYNPIMSGSYNAANAETANGGEGKIGYFANTRTKELNTGGVSYSNRAAEKAAATAQSIKNSGINIFSIGVALESQDLSQMWSYIIDTTGMTANEAYAIGSTTASYKNWLENTIAGGQLLTGSDSKYSDAYNLDQLNKDFNSIIYDIEHPPATTMREFYTLDPMSGVADFIGFYDKDGNLATTPNQLTGESKQNAENTAVFGTYTDENSNTYEDTIHWKMLESGFTMDGNNLVFTLKYRVRLKNESNGFVFVPEKTDGYDMNNKAKLWYSQKYVESGEDVEDGTGYLDYPTPKTNGYAGSFEFTKVDATDTTKNLSGAKFTLTHKGNNCSVCNGDAAIHPFTAESDASGKVEFKNIPSGHQYTLKETEAPEGYVASSKEYAVTVSYGVVTIGNSDDMFKDGIFKNNPETITVKLQKKWVDGNNQDGSRPTEIYARLVAKVENSSTTYNVVKDAYNRDIGNVSNHAGVFKIDASTAWAKTVENLPKYDTNKKPITYEWRECVWDSTANSYITLNNDGKITLKNSAGKTFEYTANYEQATALDKDGIWHTTITNTYTPETVNIVVNKTWEYEANQSSVVIPKLDDEKPVQIQLLKNNDPVTTVEVVEGDKVVNKSGVQNLRWLNNQTPSYTSSATLIATSQAITWQGLPRYENGEEIVWDVAEILGEHKNNYTISETYQKDTNTGYVTINMKNTYDPTHRSLLVNKYWDDNNNQDGIRPAKIQVALYYKWETTTGKAYDWQPVGDKTPQSGTHNHTTLNENNSNAADFFAYVDGVVELDATTDSSLARDSNLVWGYIWEKLPQYHNHTQEGQKITYKVVEVGYVDGEQVKPLSDLGYYGSKDTDGTLNYVVEDEVKNNYWALELTNRYAPEKIKIVAHKVWKDDGEHKDVLLRLYGNGISLYDRAPEGYKGNYEKLLTANSDEWKAEWTVPKYHDGKEIEWTVREMYNANPADPGDHVAPGMQLANGYTVHYLKVDEPGESCICSEQADIHFVVTNTIEQEYIDIGGIKKWTDDKVHDEVKIKLFRDDELFDQTTASTTTNWIYAFYDVPVYAVGENEDGHKYDYRVEETTVDGYVASYDIKELANGNLRVDITNTDIDQKDEFVDIRGEKIWNDNGNILSKRPDSITVNLFQNGRLLSTTTSSIQTGWQFAFTGLEKGYEDSADGNKYKEYVYTIEEEVDDKTAEHYRSLVVKTQNGYDIINTLITEDAGQIQVGKLVSGNGPADAVYKFILNITANVPNWSSLDAWKLYELQKAHDEAKADLAAANSAWEAAKAEFMKNARQLKTSSSAIMFAMTETVTSPSGLQYEYLTMVNDHGYVHTTTSSSYDYDGLAKDGDPDESIVAHVVDAIQELAEDINRANSVFLKALQEKVNDLVYALGFKKDDAQNLLDTAGRLFDAKVMEQATSAAAYEFKNKVTEEKTSPSAITLIVKETSDIEVERISMFNEDGKYEYAFELRDGWQAGFDIEATSGSSIQYWIEEIEDHNADSTDIALNGTKVKDGVKTDEYTLKDDHPFFLFTNYFKSGGGGGDNFIDRTVKKVWDDNHSADRPAEVTVNLLCNGDVYKTVTLSAANSWQHTWTGLSASYTWSVEEVNVPDGYSASDPVLHGTTWTITNTLDSSIPEKDPDPKPEDDPDNPTDNPDENDKPGPVEPGTPVEPEPDLGDAPDTGDHSHAVPFAVLMLIAMAGLVITRRKFN